MSLAEKGSEKFEVNLRKCCIGKQQDQNNRILILVVVVKQKT